MQLIVYADGGSKKTGESVCGASIQDIYGVEIASISKNIGVATNNKAEYGSAILGVKKAKELGATEVQLIMDSQLVIKQLSGEYTVSKDHLKPLYKELLELLESLDNYYLTWVPRELNKRADQLAGEAYGIS